MSPDQCLADDVQDLYQWIDDQVQHVPGLAGPCNACGKCCQFDAYDHRLYVTNLEIIYFRRHIGSDLLSMDHGVCPYQMNQRCSVHEHRFAACRIFYCQGQMEKQAALSEQVSAAFKTLSEKHKRLYQYMDLHTALQT